MSPSSAREFLNHVGGESRRSGTGQLFDDINPADNSDIVGRFQASSAEDAAEALRAAVAGFDVWRRTPVSSRARILDRAAAYLEAHAPAFGEEMTREQGKPIALSKDEFIRSAQTLRFYAVEAQSFGGETLPNDDPDMVVHTMREPLGVVTVITPWNFPASIPARKIAPALMAGNAVIFKPSSDAPLSGYRLTEALVESGLPGGVLNFITGSAEAVGLAITESPLVRAISFTGSTAAGARIHRSAPFTTRTQMELGGKNPLVVMEDADLDLAVDLTIKGGLSLTGQACTGTSRVLVMDRVISEYSEKLVGRIRSLKIGNGLERGNDIGPLATAAQLRTVLDYIAVGKREARLLYGGDRLTGPQYDRGYFVTPAIFTDVMPQMRIAREEIFGPVIAIMAVSSYADAVAKANDTDYGLSASIVTRNPKYMHDFLHDIQAGTVKVNRPTTGNLINAPFGGLKNSSTATFRESGRGALEFYTQIKTVYRGC
jgi:alpha-ketoglutaric semialdehyde dehydrogenase